MTHTCPACGKQWECECTDNVRDVHYRALGEHYEEICCSEKCARHLAALLVAIARMGWR